ncbi:hypothetical protein ACN20G_36865 (plasmid) [Streptomyces sp. BI20]|uniref:hypothetical protein n=1 Tax=Streptomyces sp. BI20 TaxID=3403460 RepID=UPI003C74191F
MLQSTRTRYINTGIGLAGVVLGAVYADTVALVLTTIVDWWSSLPRPVHIIALACEITVIWTVLAALRKRGAGR